MHQASLSDYVSLARPSHWVKHVFILPGIVLAGLLHEQFPSDLGTRLLFGFASAACLASANYVLNEWLDRTSDAHHPEKSGRPAVAKDLSPGLVALEYLGLAVLGLVLASQINRLFLYTSIVFLVMGWLYNVAPVRTKDVPYLDVITESFNNPLRLTLGWAMVDGSTLPPGSLLGAYWMGGAFLMTVKRLAEYRAVIATRSASELQLYRRSFRRYTESSLLVSALVYALLCGFFVAVFFVKYRIEYLLALPALAGVFGVYLSVGLKEGSAAQSPERLLKETRLMVAVTILVLVLLLMSWIDIPALARLTDPHYIRLPNIDSP